MEIALFDDSGRQITDSKTYDPELPAEMTFSITSATWPLTVQSYGTWTPGLDYTPVLAPLDPPATFKAPGGEYTLLLTSPSA